MGPEERRHDARVKLNHLAYIRLQSGNGGIVLDVSQSGLGFHAAGPIETDELIRFRLSVKPVDQLEATGELAWNDDDHGQANKNDCYPSQVVESPGLILASNCMV